EALDRAVALGLKKTPCEVAVAYETRFTATSGEERAAFLAHGVTVARPGAGFPGLVHLERFAGPARICLTDEARLAGVGGLGMLALVTSPADLGAALTGEGAALPALRSVHVQLLGRMRPFVCARDVMLELVRRGLRDVVAQAGGGDARVVVELAGP